MTTAAIVGFFLYGPEQRGNNNYLVKFFLKHYRKWAQHIDHLYVVDSGGCLRAEDGAEFKALGKTTIHTLGRTAHWDWVDRFLLQIGEDKFFILDSDTVVYNPDFVKENFDKLEEFDIIAALDTSGHKLYEKHPGYLAENEYRSVRNRIVPYASFFRNDFFKRIGAVESTPKGQTSPGGEWYDSFGKTTDKLLSLNPRFLELQDDRMTCSYVDGAIHLSAFMDSAHHLWSAIGTNNTGWYHIRNYSGGLKLVEAKALDAADYKRHKDIMPPQEGLRLLAWLWFVADDDAYRREILAVVDEFGVSEGQFREYLVKFKELHGWLGSVV